MLLSFFIHHFTRVMCEASLAVTVIADNITSYALNGPKPSWSRPLTPVEPTQLVTASQPHCELQDSTMP